MCWKSLSVTLLPVERIPSSAARLADALQCSGGQGVHSAASRVQGSWVRNHLREYRENKKILEMFLVI